MIKQKLEKVICPPQRSRNDTSRLQFISGRRPWTVEFSVVILGLGMELAGISEAHSFVLLVQKKFVAGQ